MCAAIASGAAGVYPVVEGSNLQRLWAVAFSGRAVHFEYEVKSVNELEGGKAPSSPGLHRCLLSISTQYRLLLGHEEQS
jgi:hypothetical protein